MSPKNHTEQSSDIAWKKSTLSPEVVQQENTKREIAQVRASVYEELKDVPLEKIQVWKVSDDVFGVQYTTSGPSFFQKKNGEAYFVTGSVAKWPFFTEGMKLAGYHEKSSIGTNNEKIFDLYELVGADKKGNAVSGKKIDPQSAEYFKAWKDTKFYSDTLSVISILDPYMARSPDGKHVTGIKKDVFATENIRIDQETIVGLVQGGSVKIELLELLLNRKIIDQNSFNIAMKEVQKILPSQCADTRFEKFDAKRAMANSGEFREVWTPISRESIQKYYLKKQISESVARACIQKLDAKK